MTPGKYRLALDPISQALLRAALTILAPALRAGAGERAKRVAAAKLTLEIRRARADIAKVTAEFMQAQAREQGSTGKVHLPEPRPYPVEAARSIIDQAAKDGLGRLTSRVTEQAAFAVVRHAEQVGRDMIFDASEVYEDDDADELNVDIELDDPDDGDDYGLDDDDDEEEEQARPEPPRVADVEPANVTGIRPVAWARLLTGADNCAFCVMLASRGCVYKSKSTALYGHGSTRYHDRCDCIGMPVYNRTRFYGSAAGRESKRLYQFWLDSTEGHSGRDAINALARELNRMKKDGQEIAPDIRKAA